MDLEEEDCQPYYTSPFEIIHRLWDSNYHVPAEFYLVTKKDIYDKCIEGKILNDAGRYVLDLALKRRYGIAFNNVTDYSTVEKFPVELGDLDERSIKGILKYLVMVYE